MDMKLCDNVVLGRDFLEKNLQLGDVAVLIDFIPHPSGGETGAILEIFNAIGESITVVAVPISAIKSPEKYKDTAIFNDFGISAIPALYSLNHKYLIGHNII